MRVLGDLTSGHVGMGLRPSSSGHRAIIGSARRAIPRRGVKRASNSASDVTSFARIASSSSSTAAYAYAVYTIMYCIVDDASRRIGRDGFNLHCATFEGAPVVGFPLHHRQIHGMRLLRRDCQRGVVYVMTGIHIAEHLLCVLMQRTEDVPPRRIMVTDVQYFDFLA